MPIELPKIIFGSSALGNLYRVVPDATKLSIVDNWIRYQRNAVIDSAGKYGAGLALENIGRFLKKLKVDPASILISNKLGWKRIPLTSKEPTFEKGAWFGIEYDAVQCISYDGILECYHQGNELLGDYRAQLLSVHDPDEYLNNAKTEAERKERYRDIINAYQALSELRDSGCALGIGVGSKDWKIIQRLYDDGIHFDWVMLANSFTLLTHPPEVMEFIHTLHETGIQIINSAVFNAGFLTGGQYFDYQVVSRDSHSNLFKWRDYFIDTCEQHNISPALACCQFALSPPGVVSLALNTSNPERVADNVKFANEKIPPNFWKALKENRLLEENYPYL
ncbi:MAG: aldo/keto reductase [Verrucomicrobiota bacterium]|nr:aldo/keto reductase [Verrucomicrobiota bacterium]